MAFPVFGKNDAQTKRLSRASFGSQRKPALAVRIQWPSHHDHQFQEHALGKPPSGL
jgi:hypothetical protein